LPNFYLNLPKNAMDQTMQNLPKYAQKCKYARKYRNMQKYALRTWS